MTDTTKLRALLDAATLPEDHEDHGAADYWGARNDLINAIPTLLDLLEEAAPFVRAFDVPTIAGSHARTLTVSVEEIRRARALLARIESDGDK